MYNKGGSMAIIKVEKKNKNSNNTPVVNVKKNPHIGNDSLDSLNNLTTNFNDSSIVEENLSAGMGDNNTIKNETSLISAVLGVIFSSFIMTLIDVIFLSGIIFLILYFTDLAGKVKSFFSLISSNIGVTHLFCIIVIICLIIVCFLAKGNIRGSIKRKFKYKYLSKINIYVYDVFVGLWNFIFYIFIIVLFFIIVNNYSDIFDLFVKLKFITANNVKLDGYNYVKYIIVVIASIFMSLNAMRDITLVHKLNQFVFDEEM